jgi:hypothetical protein
MPIFVQSTSVGRANGGGLSRVRIREDDREGGRQTGAVRDRERTREPRGDVEAREPGANRNLSALLSRSQRAELILQRIRSGRDTGQAEATSAAAQDEVTEPGGGRAETAVLRRQPSGGVGTVRTAADDAVDRPGRLVPGRTSTIINRTQSPVGRLNLPEQATARPEFPTANRTETPAMDRGQDANIRLLASRSRGRAAIEQAVTPEEMAVAREAVATPTAEQISRANTTEEIRTNLQAETRVVGTELQTAAARQSEETASRIARATEQAGQERQEETVGTNQGELRELRTEERQLERELAQTEREIRSRQNENARMQTGASASPAAAAATLGSRLNILSL